MSEQTNYLHHSSDPMCFLCEHKLLTAHPYMVSWFHQLKSKYINVHVSWAYRDQADQEQAFLDHKSHDHFPNSPHNRVNPQTLLPESLALDLFQIDEDSVARFSPSFYMLVAQEIKNQRLPVVWGGDFKTIGDRDHFQYLPPVITLSVA